jgi:beta-lactamase class A
MYSTAKVPIMLAVLDRAVREDRRVSQRERGLIEAMIQQSDNNAASILLAEVGGADHVTSYLRGIGLDGTEINGYAWGASTTTAQDMARLMAKIGNYTILVPRLCRYALQTMQNVARSQKWGVSAGVPAGAAVALKNGWYPQPSGWGINSVGLVTGAGKQYAIAIYTNPNPSMAYGVETIERISAEVYPAVR